MADFCKACNEELFDIHSSDFAGSITEEKYKEGYAPVVLCEGCGPIQVNPEGECVSQDCGKCSALKQVNTKQNGITSS